MTQVELGERIGLSRSDLSKLERREDVRVSTLRAYLNGLGGELRLAVEVDGILRPFDIGSDGGRPKA